MKKIKEIIVVEGKSDTALLKELFEVDTIETHGLALDKKTLELIKEANKTRGVQIFLEKKYEIKFKQLFLIANMPLFLKKMLLVKRS